MSSLESWFRAQFVPNGESFAFRHDGSEVIFSEAEVEGFVAQWRRLWFSPLLWGAYGLLGLALPIWLWLKGYEGAAYSIAGVAALMLIVSLIHVARRPHEAAWERLPAKPVTTPGAWRPSAAVSALWILACLLLASNPSGNWNLFWLVGAVFGAINLTSALWSLSYRRKHNAEPKEPRIFARLRQATFLLFIAGILIGTLLWPDNRSLRMAATYFLGFGFFWGAVWLVERFKARKAASA